MTDRCVGSGQAVFGVPAWHRTPCPVCNRPTSTVPADQAGTVVLVEHRARQTEALPISLDLFGV